MTPGRFAIPTDAGFYDSLWHVVRPESDLASNFLCARQERQAVENRLLTVGTSSVVVIPSMECNLRCPHCYVAQHLKRPSGNTLGNIDLYKLLDFVDAVRTQQNLINVYFVGGEPLLHHEFIRRVMQGVGSMTYGITTNGMWDFAAVSDVLAQCRYLTFSIDGLPDDHNKVRKSVDHDSDPFAKTYRNLHRANKELPAGVEVHVQGSMVIRQYDPAEIKLFFGIMLLAGIKRDFISLASPATTERWHSEVAREKLQNVRRMYPCCDFTLGHTYVVYGDMIYSSYYQLDQQEPLGKLGESLESLNARHADMILKSAPVLHDDTCMNHCTGVGACWGFCSNARHSFGNRPSSVCNRDAVEQKVIELAKKAGHADRPESCRL